MKIVAKRVCVCGGGNIAHAVAAVLSRMDNVTVLTRRPTDWSATLSFHIGNSDSIQSVSIETTTDPRVVAEAEFVFVTVPRFAIRETLKKIDIFLHEGQSVLFLPAPAAMEEIVADYAKRRINTVGFQRVPNVARIIEYGHHVWIGDTRPVCKIAFSSNVCANDTSAYIEERFGTRVDRLASFLSFTFSNSNPLLHPSRLVTLLKNGANGIYAECPYFYGQWPDEASELYIKADSEMFAAFRHYSPNDAAHDYESALVHYESKTMHEMTLRIESIESLKPIRAPWRKCEDGLWHPDYDSRYFTEDIPYGTRIIQRYAHKEHIPVPTIDFMVEFISQCIAEAGNKTR